MAKGKNLAQLKASWKEEPKKSAPNDGVRDSIVKSGKSVRTSISIDSAIWEAAGDLAHELNKETKALGIKGGFAVSRLATVALLHFHSLSFEEQLALIKRHW